MPKLMLVKKNSSTMATTSNRTDTQMKTLRYFMKSILLSVRNCISSSSENVCAGGRG